jgi:hypothetical protein
MAVRGCGIQDYDGILSMACAEDLEQTTLLSESPGMTCLDTESEKSTGNSDIEAINLPALLKHVDLPGQLPDCATLPLLADDACSPHQVSKDLSHASLIKTAILQGRLIDASQVRRRRRQKGPYETTTLKQLIQEPSLVHAPSVLTRDMHKKGLNEFRYWYVRQSQKKWKQVCDAAKVWATLSTQLKYHWYLVHRATVVLHKKGRCRDSRSKGSVSSHHEKIGACSSNTSGTSQLDNDLKVLGLLLTYCPVLGMDDPEVGSMIRGGLRGDALRKALTLIKHISTISLHSSSSFAPSTVLPRAVPAWRWAITPAFPPRFTAMPISAFCVEKTWRLLLNMWLYLCPR